MNSRPGLLAVTLCVAVVSASLVGSPMLSHWRHQGECRIAAAAFEYLEDVRAAQQLYFIQNGKYATSIDELDVRMPPPVRFSVAMVGAGAELTGPTQLTGTTQPAGPTHWALTLIRAGSPLRPPGYAVTYSDRGYEPARSTIDPAIAPNTVDLRLAGSRSGDPK